MRLPFAKRRAEPPSQSRAGRSIQFQRGASTLYIRVISAIFLLLAASVTVLAPKGVFAQQNIEKTVCLSTIGYTSVDAFREILLATAKRALAEELFGEIVTATTSVRDFTVTGDEVRTLVTGYLRVAGSPTYFNGAALGEGCTTIRGYVSAEDQARFAPVMVTKLLCLADPDLTTGDLRDQTEETALLQALYNYDGHLLGHTEDNVRRLAKRLSIESSGFLPNTLTYCVSLQAYVVPIEVETYLVEASLTSTAVIPSGEGAAGAPHVVAAGELGTPVPPSEPTAAATPQPAEFATGAAVATTQEKTRTAEPPTEPTAMPTMGPVARATAMLSASPTEAATILDTLPSTGGGAMPSTGRAPFAAATTPAAIGAQSASTAPLPAPKLLAPQDNSTFDSQATIVLVWLPVKPTLEADEQYLITVRYKRNGQLWTDFGWSSTSSWTLSNHKYLRDSAELGEYQWSVKLVRQDASGENGLLSGVDLSATSPVQRLYWRNPLEESAVHARPTPTTVPPPFDPPAFEPLPEDPPAFEPLPEDPPAFEPLPEDPPAVEPLPEDPPAVEPLPEDPPAVEPLPEDPPTVEPLPEDPPTPEPVPEEPPTPEPPAGG